MDDKVGRFVSSFAYILAVISVVVGITVALNMHDSITELNETLKEEASSSSGLFSTDEKDEEVESYDEQSTSVAWIPFFIGLLVASILMIGGRIVDYLGDIRHNMTLKNKNNSTERVEAVE